MMALAETVTALGETDNALLYWQHITQNHSYPRAKVQLAELYAARNEPDLAPVTLDDGEPASIIKLIPERSSNPRDALLQNESLDRFDRARLLFSAFLGPDRELHHLFRLYCDGRSKSRDLATALRTQPRAIKNLRRRFLRKWNRFHKRF